MMSYENNVNIRLLSMNGDSVVIEVSLLVDASHSFVRKFRVRPGMSLSVKSEIDVYGDTVTEISKEADRAIAKARRHEHI
jgi:3-deoxy-D-manno-octulosonate 8-phosphate phosphatase KdsC-like HAD superfamily phosphatase